MKDISYLSIQLVLQVLNVNISNGEIFCLATRSEEAQPQLLPHEARSAISAYQPFECRGLFHCLSGSIGLAESGSDGIFVLFKIQELRSKFNEDTELGEMSPENGFMTVLSDNENISLSEF